MARKITIRMLEDLEPARFEELVAALVQREHPDAVHLQAPDGGADVLLEHAPRGGSWAWQVKSYPRDIKWADCERSLDDAMNAYSPVKVVFAFPCGMTKPRLDKFKQRLVERHAGVDVGYLSAGDLIDRLRSQPGLVAEFFGDDPNDVAGAVVAAVKTELEGPALTPVERRMSQALRTAAADSVFRCEVAVTEVGAPSPSWDEPPYMHSVEAAGRDAVRITAWPRHGPVPQPGWRFAKGEEGRQARLRLRLALAQGKSATLTEGVEADVPTPDAIAEGLARVAPGKPWGAEVEFGPTEIHELVATAEHEGEVFEERFELQGMPSLDDDENVRSFGCARGGLVLWLDVVLGPRPKISIRSQLETFTTDDFAETATAARFALAYLAGQVTLAVPSLLSGPPNVIKQPPPPEEQDARVRSLFHVYDGLAAIEEHLGRRLTIPDEADGDDAAAAARIASILRTRRGTMTVTELGRDFPEAEVDAFIDAVSNGQHMTARVPVLDELFGQGVELGRAQVDLPMPPLVLPGKPAGGVAPVTLRWSPPARVAFELE